LRTPPDARVLSTHDAGPVMILTTAVDRQFTERRVALEARGAEVIVSPDASLRTALRCLGERDIGSLLLEGGAAIHEAAWDEGVVDFVRLYLTPHEIGTAGLRFLDGRQFSTSGLFQSRTEPLGPDVLIEGYVHGPR